MTNFPETPFPESNRPESEYLGIDLRHRFDDKLVEIRANIVDTGTLALANIRLAGDVITQNRLEDIQMVRDADIPVNEQYRRCEAEVFEVLSLQQPVATDLRFLVASTRILYEIERSGDLAVNLVNALGHIDGLPSEVLRNPLIGELAEASAAMFESGIEAVATMDPDIGLNAEAEDEKVDFLTAELYKASTSIHENLGLEVAVALFRMGRFFERIADHGVNIAQNVTFTVTGNFPDED